MQQLNFCVYGAVEATSDCTPFKQSLVYTDPEYTYSGHLLDISGVSQTLSNLPALSTLFAPTDAAFDAYINGSGITPDEAAINVLQTPGAKVQVVPGQYYSVLLWLRKPLLLHALSVDANRLPGNPHLPYVMPCGQEHGTEKSDND